MQRVALLFFSVTIFFFYILSIVFVSQHILIVANYLPPTSTNF